MVIIRFFLKGIPMAALLFVFSCENSIEKINLVASKEKVPFETTTGAVVIYSDSGKVQVKVEAGRIDRYTGENPYAEMSGGVKVFFYDSDIKVESQLSAQNATHYEKESRMEARNDVIVINRKGEMLNTEHLIWDEKEEKIYTDEFVKITTSDEIIYGHGFEANQDFTQYKIMNIKGTIQIKEEDEEVQ